MKVILTIIGTRPEAIKLAPIVSAIARSERLRTKICITKQHTDLLEPFIKGLDLKVDYQFEDESKQRSLSQHAAGILKELEPILADCKPDLVLVQGDTISAFAAALCAFYAKIPIAHVEAGLRTGHLGSPWPEEVHRCFIDKLASYFFVPSQISKVNLQAEGVACDRIWVVGNTSIDALRVACTSLKLTKGIKRNILVTVHRRENHGQPLNDICCALLELAKQFYDVDIIFALHPNPAIREPVIKMLAEVPNIHLIEALDHLSFLQLLQQSTFVMTDSGGVQEEATYFGKPLVVLRDTTERPEGIHAGTARLVGTKQIDIIACCQELLQTQSVLKQMSKAHFPYGQGHAATKIVDILEQELC